MASPNRTPWFDAMTQEPRRAGEYQYMPWDFTNYAPVERRTWGGYFWIDRLDGEPLIPWPGDLWRGLAEPPK